MLQQGQNLAVVNNSSPSTYCFDADAVNEFFLSYMPAETLARTIREFNHHVAILSLNTPRCFIFQNNYAMKIKTIYHLDDACEVTMIEEKMVFFQMVYLYFFS
jgi:hypothetical protein